MAKNHEFYNQSHENPHWAIELKVFWPVFDSLRVVQISAQESQLVIIWLVKWVLDSIALQVI